MEIGRELPTSLKKIGDKTARAKKDPLLIAILGTAFFLAVSIFGTAVIWGTGPVLMTVPWYIPLVSSFAALITLLIGFIALGRYQVLRDPVSFWVGSGFAVYGIGQIFNALSWPGLMPNGASILGNLSGTSPWIGLVDLTLLEIFLMAAVINPWPNRLSLPGNQWLKPVLIFLLSAMAGFALLLIFERSLPALVDARGFFTLLQRIWSAGLRPWASSLCSLDLRPRRRVDLSSVDLAL
ncbi:MAG: hypothetical protein ACM3XO_11930, partial [Bacteroidota bacterium]